jgi:prepilin-type N-terminal cleavage/methylation domain-containing protein
MNRHVAPRRGGYSLLELMIALGLLGGLLALAWSLIGSYRTAEQRGWGQANRMQVVRAAREMIEDDVDHWSAASFEASPNRAASNRASINRAASSSAFSNRTRSTTRFRGSGSEMSIEMLPSIDPLPWLEEVTNDGGEVEPARGGDRSLGGTLGGASSAGGGRDDDVAQSTIRPLSRPLGPLQRVRLRYTLVPAGTTADGQRLMNLRRQMTVVGGDDPKDVDSPVDSPSDRVLSTADLYRVGDDDSRGETATGAGGDSTMVRGLVGARFRYCGGKEWFDSWDETTRGGLPRAIELSFDLPDATNPNEIRIERPEGSDAAGRDGLAADDPLGDVLSRDVVEPVSSGMSGGGSGRGGADTGREIRVVVRVADGVAVGVSSSRGSAGGFGGVNR